mgnify:CR=1 FL=1
MPNIKPISDLRNYASVLETVEVGKPLYLTKNGRGMYTVMDMKEQQKKAELYDQMQTKLELMHALMEGKISGEREGWVSAEEAKEMLRRGRDAKDSSL